MVTVTLKMFFMTHIVELIMNAIHVMLELLISETKIGSGQFCMYG